MKNYIPHVVVPHSVLRLKQLSCLDKMVLSYVLDFTGSHSALTDSKISELLFIRKNLVRKSIAKLKKLDLWPEDMIGTDFADGKSLPFFSFDEASNKPTKDGEKKGFFATFSG